MPQSRRAGTPAAAKPAAEEAAEPILSIRDRADAVRHQSGYFDEGRLTPPMLVRLYPLLEEPVDPKYIEHTPPKKGKPYESTGLRSVQVQIDRMNDVLGLPHWRVLYRYASAGELCQVVGVIGNNLAECRLDETGQLVVGTADVLGVREGWGGHNRGTQKGDLYKGSETNALKRTLARFGPGAHVYRLDFDDDVNLADQPELRATEQAREQQTRDARREPTEAQLVEQLQALLELKDDHAEQRAHIEKGMGILGTTTKIKLQQLSAADDKEKLDALEARVNVAVEQQGPEA